MKVTVPGSVLAASSGAMSTGRVGGLLTASTRKSTTAHSLNDSASPARTRAQCRASSTASSKTKRRVSPSPVSPVICTRGAAKSSDVAIATSEDFAAPLVQMTGLTGEGETLLFVFEDAVEDARHWARVRAGDAESFSEWAVVDFLVDAVNSPPTRPVLIAPEDAARTEPGTVTFTWEPATDLWQAPR